MKICKVDSNEEFKKGERCASAAKHQRSFSAVLLRVPCGLRYPGLFSRHSEEEVTSESGIYLEYLCNWHFVCLCK